MSVRLRALAEDPDAERLTDALAPGLYEAGKPYFDRMFGDPAAGVAAVRRYLASERSELSIRRVTVLEDGGELVGAFVGVEGADMPRCARADSLLALKLVGREGRAGFLRSAAALAELRRPIEADQWFMSKLWVTSERRGRGYARMLMREFVAAAERHGLPRCRVDAYEGDVPVLGLYESEGFEQRSIAHSADGTLGLIEMVREG